MAVSPSNDSVRHFFDRTSRCFPSSSVFLVSVGLTRDSDAPVTVDWQAATGVLCTSKDNDGTIYSLIKNKQKRTTRQVLYKCGKMEKVLEKTQAVSPLSEAAQCHRRLRICSIYRRHRCRRA